MGNYYDASETLEPDVREQQLFARLPDYLNRAITGSSGLAKHLAGHDLTAVTDRAALAGLPVLRKQVLMDAQAENPVFGGFADLKALRGQRVFMSPGPIWEPQGVGIDPWQSARALFAAGFNAGDIVHSSLSYHMTPGGFILDEGLRALGCIVFPAGVGDTEAQVTAAKALQPDAFVGTPDYLKIMLDKAGQMDVDLSCIKRALVSGGALFPSLRAEYLSRGIVVMQAYATADLGVVAYESRHEEQILDGMIVSENLIVEIVRPGSDDPVEEGDVGEIVVTNFNLAYPLVRFATGDLSAMLPGTSPCGRSNMRIAGWLGRADQRTKIKGMFVDPKQINMIVKLHPAIDVARLVVSRKGASDVMELKVKPVEGGEIDLDLVTRLLREITKLGGKVAIVENLPNDGKVIADERDYEA